MKDNILEARLKDLAEISLQQNRYTYTNFLNLEEFQTFLEIKKELECAGIQIYKEEMANERKIVRFGNEERLFYNEDWPVCILKIAPKSLKFSEQLTHKDYLGALMNLGITREKFGDLYLKENGAYVFCLMQYVDYIKESLLKVKHTVVQTSVVEQVEELSPEFKNICIIVTSNRLDATVAALCHISRSKAVDEIHAKRVLLNGSIIEKIDYVMKIGQVITIRGNGKYIFDGEIKKTQKGRIQLSLREFV